VAITPSPRAARAADAAIAVLAEHGARGLTHRAVDRAAGLPPGTTSNYARTRGALLRLTLARIAELDAAEGAAGADGPAGTGPAGSGPAGSGPAVRGPGGPGSQRQLPVAVLAEFLAGAVDRMLTQEQARRRVQARFELAFEATRRPELRAAYDEMGRGFREQAAGLLAAAGSAEPDSAAWTLVAWIEGTLFYALAGAGGAAVPLAASLRVQLTRLLAGLCGEQSGRA
jgi:hypothetical protein